MVMQGIRVLASELVRRYDLMARAGKTYNGKRDMYEALGYKRVLSIDDYWDRYCRGGIAKRVVDTLPKATWRGGGYVFEEDDLNTVTPFEAEWDKFAERMDVWSVLERSDRLAGVGHYSGIVIGAPGELTAPLPRLRSTDDINFLKVYREGMIDIDDLDLETDTTSERFGQPRLYKIKFNEVSQRTLKVHWSRVLHIAPEILDDELYSTPRLEAVWNLLDDLDKVTGGGAEAFWIRANNIMQFDVDKDLQMQKDDEYTKALQEQVDELTHNIRRVIRTRGVEMNTAETKTAEFHGNADEIRTQIAGTAEIPKRILFGSEQGELASTQDRFNFAEQIADRREQSAKPRILRPFVQRLINCGALPTPKAGRFDVWWPEARSLDPVERAKIAEIYHKLNEKQIVVTTQEIRAVVSLPPLDEDMITAELDLHETERDVAKEMMPEFNQPKPGDPDFEDDVVDDEDLDRAAKQLLARKRAARAIAINATPQRTGIHA